jgi:O-antigen ligase
VDDTATGPRGPVLFGLLAAMLVFAPLIRGGNRPIPLLVLEIAAVTGLAACAWHWLQGAPRPRLPATLRWGLAILLLAPLLQLVPIPASWWAALPGHAPYQQALALTGEGGARAASIHPRATEYAWLAMLPCLAAFVLAVSQRRSRVRRLVTVFVAVALAEAIIGIIQLGAGGGSPLYFGITTAAGAAIGTYVNKNHFSALMAMALPMAVALWALAVMPPTDGSGARLKSHPRHADRRVAIRIAASVAVMLLLVALFFSASRGGIGSGLFVFALATGALVWRSGPPAARIAFGTVGVITLVFGAYVGLTSVLERFAPERLSFSYENRLAIAAAATRAALDFLPLGSGLGTFADVFRRYQVEGLPGFIDHAHNDYAEAFLELGVAGIAAIGLLGIAYLGRWVELLRQRSSRSLGPLQVAAGLGMLAMILHGLVDFNFHIPANALYFSFLAGIFFLTPDEGRA